MVLYRPIWPEGSTVYIVLFNTKTNCILLLHLNPNILLICGSKVKYRFL